MAVPKKLHIVITGAASGIGNELARRVLADGHNLLAVDINAEPLTELNRHAKGGQLYCECIDVRDSKHWQLLEQKIPEIWPQLDVVINVAGVIRPGWIQDQVDVDVDYHFDINTKGAIFGTQMAAQIMMPQRSGHIINISSLAGIAAVPGISLYSASKFAVRGYSLAVAQELKQHNISVSVVCPDLVDTPMLAEELDYEEETAVVFSGNKVLSVESVCDAILSKVLKDKPLELMIPNSRGRLAQLSSLLPSVSGSLSNALAKKGQRTQQKIIAERAGEQPSNVYAMPPRWLRNCNPVKLLKKNSDDNKPSNHTHLHDS